MHNFIFAASIGIGSYYNGFLGACIGGVCTCIMASLDDLIKAQNLTNEILRNISFKIKE